MKKLGFILMIFMLAAPVATAKDSPCFVDRNRPYCSQSIPDDIDKGGVVTLDSRCVVSIEPSLGGGYKSFRYDPGINIFGEGIITIQPRSSWPYRLQLFLDDIFGGRCHKETIKVRLRRSPPYNDRYEALD